MEKSPAFQFYPNDWLSSTAIALMPPEYEGAYIHLLCHMWNDPDCSLPDNDEELAVLSRLGKRWFKGGSTVVRKCLQSYPNQNGKLTNLRLLKEREKQKLWKEKSIEGGKKSAKLRELQKKSEVKGGSKLVATKRQPKGNSSSSFSSSSSYYKDIKNIYPWLPDKEWDAYLEMRKSKGNKVAITTESVALYAIKELEKLKNQGNDPAEVLKKSIIGSYQGLFPVKDGSSNAPVPGKVKGAIDYEKYAKD